MKTREQNRNNKRTKIQRFDWFIERIQTRVAFGWLSERRELSRNQTILPFDVILQHDWPIEQCFLHIRVFFGGKTKRPCFDLLIHWLIKQITNTYRNHFSRSYRNRSTQTERHFRSPNDHVDMEVSPHRGTSKTVLNSGLNAVDSGFQVPDSSLCQWNLGFGFVDLYSGLQSPAKCSRIPDSTSKKSGSLTWGKIIIACVQTPPPLSKNRRRGPSPIFTEGRGGSVQRLDNKCPQLILTCLIRWRLNILGVCTKLLCWKLSV